MVYKFSEQKIRGFLVKKIQKIYIHLNRNNENDDPELKIKALGYVFDELNLSPKDTDLFIINLSGDLNLPHDNILRRVLKNNRFLVDGSKSKLNF